MAKEELDFTKPMVTMLGREVKIFMTDAGGLYPVIGAYKNDQGGWISCQWAKDGHAEKDDPEHTIHYKREKFEIVDYINIYRNTETGDIFIKETVRCKSREEADKYDLSGRENLERIAVKKIVVAGQEGDFDT